MSWWLGNLEGRTTVFDRLDNSFNAWLESVHSPGWRRFLSAAAIVFSTAAAVITIVSEIHFYLFIISLLCILIGVLVYKLTRSSSDEGQKLKNALTAISPHASFLADWLQTTVLARHRISDLRTFDGYHHLKRYTRNVQIIGADIHVHEEFEAVNFGQEYSATFKVMRFGGSSQPYAALHSKAVQVFKDGKADEESLSIEVLVDDERYKILQLILNAPARQGDTFEVHYDDMWPGAMRLGLDGVFYTPILYYARGTGLMQSTIAFDTKVNQVTAYSYDLNTGECKPTETQPDRRSATQGSSEYYWELPNPANSKLYFVLFTREEAVNTENQV